MDIKKFLNFGCAVTVEEGVIYTAPINEHNKIVDGWTEVTAPADGFITEVNKQFNTTFSEEEFAGR